MTLFDEHQKITRVLEKECMNVDELEKKTRLGKMNIIDHLTIKNMDMAGNWTSDDGEFCSYEVLQKLYKSLLYTND